MLNIQVKLYIPKTVYFWKVKTWDNHGIESEFSDNTAVSNG
jgi:hypothetical protein